MTSVYEFWNRVTKSQAEHQKGGGPSPRTLAVHGALNHGTHLLDGHLAGAAVGQVEGVDAARGVGGREALSGQGAGPAGKAWEAGLLNGDPRFEVGNAIEWCGWARSWAGPW